MKAKTIVLNKPFGSAPTSDNFKIIEEDLPEVKNGEFLVEAEYISVDPLVRYITEPQHVGKCIRGDQVGKIIKSNNDHYPVGEYVIGEFGWRTLTISDGSTSDVTKFPPKILASFGEKIPRSLALGALGMPGNTAYFGFLKICKPESGNTVVISAAAGAVGSHVGQIAKIIGCYVVGITGSDVKGEKLIKQCGFDAFVNYKNKDFEKKLIEATPNRIDCYFDNVGGEISSSVLNRMNKFGRIAICGVISALNNNGEPQKASEVQTPVKINHVRMEGFHVDRWNEQWNEGITANLNWINEGRLKYFENVIEGFDNTPQAFIDMFKGKNFGKTIVKVSDVKLKLKI